jgi:peptidyl-prolyl cis-trans isomerase D
MMQAMRDRVKIIYLVVIVTFLGLTFLVWGIGLEGGKNRQSQRPTNAIVTVNGTDISYDQYNQRVNGILDQMRKQLPEGQSLSENQMMRAREQAYNNLVMETLEREQANKLGFSVSDDEIVDILSNNPPPFLLSQFTDENGKVDTEAYVRALNNPNLPWDQIENYIRSTVPLQKLENYISGQALVSEAELREAFTQQNTHAVAEYVGCELSSVDLKNEEVTDAEIQKFYDDYKADYEVPEQVSVRLVTIPKEPSTQDEQELVSILEDIRKDVLSGKTTFEEAAQTYSEDTSNASQGGELGFIDRNRMSQAFTDAAFALPVGDISKPIKTESGFQLILVEDEKTDARGKRTEVKVRHILLHRVASQATTDELRTEAKNLHDSAENVGLEKAAESANLTVTTTDPFQSTLNIPKVPNSLSGTNFAFEHDAGTLSPVFETQDMFYMFEVAQRIPAGFRPLKDVRSLIVSRIQRKRRTDAAAEKISQAWKEIKGGATLAAAAKKLGLEHAVTDTFTLRENIPGIGFATSFARAALGMKPGEMLPDVRTQRGVYIVKLIYKTPFDEAQFKAQRKSLSQSLLFTRRRELLLAWQTKLKKDAVIEDHRADFL